MDLPYNSKFQVDHINRDRLDNRRANLRLASAGQNAANSSRQTISKSGYRGITHIRDRKLKKPFLVHVRGKHYGYFETIQGAILKYNEVVTRLYGEFAIKHRTDS